MVNWFVFQFCLNVDEWNELQKEGCLVNHIGFRKKEASYSGLSSLSPPKTPPTQCVYCSLSPPKTPPTQCVYWGPAMHKALGLSTFPDSFPQYKWLSGTISPWTQILPSHLSGAGFKLTSSWHHISTLSFFTSFLQYIPSNHVQIPWLLPSYSPSFSKFKVKNLGMIFFFNISPTPMTPSTSQVI